MDLKRVVRGLARLRKLPAEERERAARRDHAGEPEVLAELLRLLPHLEVPEGFLAPPAVPGAASSDLFVPDVQAGRVLGARWRIERTIAQGAQGLVCEARDVLTEADVAVKLIRGMTPAEAARVRREAATLRWLALPGVARFLDFGEDGLDAWIVMERIEGAPFPGQKTPCPWERLRGVAVGFLECVARVHAAGVVHADLKPGNVLVDPRGVVTLVDFGLSAARTEAAYSWGTTTGGTLGYLAPEVAAGGAPTPQSDLYAAGALICQALTGRMPRGDSSDTAASIDAPAAVRGAILRMLRADPAQRPRAVGEVLARLVPRTSPRRRTPWTLRELRARFAGFERFHHVPGDAARAVLRHTRGRPAEVEALLDAWLRTGYARLEEGRIALDRASLEQLLLLYPDRPNPEAPLARALAEGRPWDVADAAHRVASRLLARGRSRRALAAVEEGVVAARAVGGTRRAGRRVFVGTRAAQTAARGVEIERARWLLRRASEPGALGAALDVVLTAASDFQAGDAPGAERRLAAVTDAGPPEAQRLAWSVRALAAQALPIERHRQILERADLWARQAGTADAQVTNRSWRAWFRYRLGDCRAAARMLRVCVRRAPDAVARLRFLTDAANCALAGGDTRQACRLAGTALRRARRARRPAQEVRAHLLLRAALASLPRTRPDVEALEAIDALGFAAHATTARRTEAAIAWRQGDPAFALRILAVLRRPADVAGLSASELLSEALRAAAGGELAESRARFVAQRSRVVAAPAITAQILALLALAPDGLRPFLRGEWRKLSLPRDRREWGRRREILSLAEASSILAGRVPSSLARAISAARSAVPRLRRHGEA